MSVYCPDFETSVYCLDFTTERIMPPFEIWNELQKESACTMFEIREMGDNWGLYCKSSDKLSDPEFSKTHARKTGSDLKKSLRQRCKQLITSDHGSIEIYRQVLSLTDSQCRGLHKDAQRFLEKHLLRAACTAPPIEKKPLSISPPLLTMDDVPFEAYEGNKRVKWNPMYPAETWNSRKMTEYIRLFGTWQSAPCSLNLAVLPRILQLEKVGEYYNPHDFLARVDVTSAIFKISFEHPFSKSVITLDMREGDMYYFSCLDPSYKVHVNNLQEETPISKVQKTRYSQGQELLKRHAEHKRIEQEQEHIDGSWEERMIHAETERLEKEEAKWLAQSKRKRVQEAEERAAKRRMGTGSMSRSSTAPLPSHDVCVKLTTCGTSSSISYLKNSHCTR